MTQWTTIDIPILHSPTIKVSKERISFNSSVHKLWNIKCYDYIETYIDTTDKNKIAFKFVKQRTKNSLKIKYPKNCKNCMIISSKVLMQALIELTNIKINNRYKAEYIDEKIVVNLTEYI